MAVPKEDDPSRMGNIPKRSQAKATERYDSSLQMFVMAPAEPDWNRLRFLRWMAEQGRLEHAVAGQSTGDFVGVINRRINLVDSPVVAA